jgi:hypothetical protein
VRRGLRYGPEVRWFWITVSAVLLGSVAAASDVVAGGLHPAAAARCVAMVANAGSVWAGLAVLAGRAVSPRGHTRLGVRAAGAGLAALLETVAAYYAYGLAFGDRLPRSRRRSSRSR